MAQGKDNHDRRTGGIRVRVTYETMYQEFLRVLEKRGFTHERAALSAKLYADASRDGVYTH